jgi:acyl dehydratase
VAVSSFEDFQLHERFTSPSRTITEDDVATLIAVGGYTHPLFTDPEYAAASAFGRTPVPGEGILHMMGGLAEQTGRFDETTIGLVGFDGVRFIKPAFAGDEIRLDIGIDAKHYTGSGKGLLHMIWICLNQDGDNILQAEARMLFRLVR